MNPLEEGRAIVHRIAASNRTIYDPMEVGDPLFWLPAPALEAVLDAELCGLDVSGLPNRTRSTIVNRRICAALGYPVPERFRRTEPRFPGQEFDKYVQKSNNLQIFNQQLAPTRRYALIRVGSDARICRVKVVTGAALAPLDTTGTLTGKYQARCTAGLAPRELISAQDTDRLRPLLRADARIGGESPIDEPDPASLLPIGALFARLSGLIGETFRNVGSDQERRRGAALHRLVCRRLGYARFADDGQFPDLRNQLLEVKLQTSPTIDLGLVLPSSADPLDVPMIGGRQIRHCDVRYAVFVAAAVGGQITLTHLILTTGAAFLGRFPQFGGNVLNAKLQIPLPRDFFER